MLLSRGVETCAEFTGGCASARATPTWFPIDNARKAFGATCPFHPMLLSVLKTKCWAARFQQTRGVLRLVAYGSRKPTSRLQGSAGIR